MAWWVAALDTRIKVCIDMCCLTEFHTFAQKGVLNHGIFYFVPSLLKHFTTSQINSLIAPRPHLGLAGNYDELTPPEGLDIIDTELKKTYKAMNAADAWKLLRYDVGHYEIPEMRREVISFLEKWL